MNHLPKLALDKLKSYLSFEYRINCKNVNRAWSIMFDFEVKTFRSSDSQDGFVFEGNRWLCKRTTSKFISFSAFDLFFDTLAKSVLSKLKHLSLCGVKLRPKAFSAFAKSLSSFRELEELSLTRIDLDHHSNDWNNQVDFEFELSVLRTVHSENVHGIYKLNLDAPKLQKAKVWFCRLRLSIVHDSVE